MLFERERERERERGRVEGGRERGMLMVSTCRRGIVKREES